MSGNIDIYVDGEQITVYDKEKFLYIPKPGEYIQIDRQYFDRYDKYKDIFGKIAKVEMIVHIPERNLQIHTTLKNKRR